MLVPEVNGLITRDGHYGSVVVLGGWPSRIMIGYSRPVWILLSRGVGRDEGRTMPCHTANLMEAISLLRAVWPDHSRFSVDEFPKEAAVTLGHKTLRTLMKRSSLW